MSVGARSAQGGDHRRRLALIGLVAVTLLFSFALQHPSEAQAANGSISGHITDEDLNDLEGVCAAAFATPGNIVAFSATDGNGGYTMSVAPGDYKVGFGNCPGGDQYVEEFYDDVPDFESGTTVTVLDGADTPNIDAALAEAVSPGSISGQVTDEALNGLTDACVGAFDFSGNLVAFDATDASGNYTIAPLQPGGYKVGFGDCPPSNIYVDEYYDDVRNFASAVTVTVFDGADTPNIDAALEVRVAPVNNETPFISGPPELGKTLRAENGHWSGATLPFTYQWRRCLDGASQCRPIAGATQRRYEPVAADLGLRLRVTVTGSNDIGSTDARSSSTRPIFG